MEPAREVARRLLAAVSNQQGGGAPTASSYCHVALWHAAKWHNARHRCTVFIGTPEIFKKTLFKQWPGRAHSFINVLDAVNDLVVDELVGWFYHINFWGSQTYRDRGKLARLFGWSVWNELLERVRFFFILEFEATAVSG